MTVVHTRNRGRERTYEGDGLTLLVAAGTFRERARTHDETLAYRAARDPIGTATAATARAGPLSRLVDETGLAAAIGNGNYEAVLRPSVGLTVAQSRVRARPSPGAVLRDQYDIESGATVRRYAVDDRPVYHLDPLERRLADDAVEMLAAAREHMTAVGPSGDRAPGAAVRAVAEAGDPVGRLTRILTKHTRGWGVLTDLFADPSVSDVFATPPVDETPLRVRADGQSLPTNVTLTDRGAETLASRFRRESGHAFSRAEPTLDAATEVHGRRIRAAGVTAPVSDGIAFAFRAHDDDVWTVPALVGNETLTAFGGALCSLAVARGAAIVVTGGRGAGKTTLLSALCWEIPPRTRTIVVEDTPELPVTALREAGRDVQRLRVSTGTGPGLMPTRALRTALRLGDGALIVGEVRGEEAAVLHRGMRVGENDGAVLGTLHAEGGASVRDRVVDDLNVPASAFAATDVVVTVAKTATDKGRQVTSVEEVVMGPDGPAFADLVTRSTGPTDRIDRGNSRLLETLRRPDESYEDVRTSLADRADWVEAAAAGSTAPEDLPGRPPC